MGKLSAGIRTSVVIAFALAFGCQDSEDQPGAGGQGELGECAGLGCAPCGDLQTLDDICHGEQRCEALADCSETPEQACEVEEGTYVMEFQRSACLGGACIFEIAAASCIDDTPCDECAESAGPTRSCASRTDSAQACGDCCASRAPAIDVSGLFGPCACEAGGPCAAACAESRYCGGPGVQTAECTSCLGTAVLPGGACFNSEAFRAGCIDGADTYCRQEAQCFAMCSLR